MLTQETPPTPVGALASPSKADISRAREERNEAINEAFFTDPEGTYKTLAIRFGVSESRVQQITAKDRALGRERVPRTDTRKVKSRLSEPLSPTHRRIGLRVGSWRAANKITSIAEAATTLGLSSDRYNKLEKGLYDPSLSELMRVLSAIGAKPDALLEGVFPHKVEETA